MNANKDQLSGRPYLDRNGDRFQRQIERFVRVYGSDIRSLVFALGLALLLFLTLGRNAPQNSLRRELALVLGGTLLGVASAIVTSALQRREGYRQGAYTERAKAVQRLMAEVRKHRGRALSQIALRGTTGAPCIRNYLLDSDNTLRSYAFEETVWIGRTGVQAFREFLESAGVDSRVARARTIEQATVLYNAAFDDLTDYLLDGLGFSVDESLNAKATTVTTEDA
jgi:hypothetical protein